MDGIVHDDHAVITAHNDGYSTFTSSLSASFFSHFSNHSFGSCTILQYSVLFAPSSGTAKPIAIVARSKCDQYGDDCKMVQLLSRLISVSTVSDAIGCSCVSLSVAVEIGGDAYTHDGSNGP
jgi:hypothetical protein